MYTYSTRTHPHPIHPMCVHIGVCQSTHALIRSLSLTHTQPINFHHIPFIIPYRPPLLPPGVPPAALQPPPALLRRLLPNAEAAYHATQEQTRGKVSTLHTHPASNAAERPCADACYPYMNQ